MSQHDSIKKEKNSQMADNDNNIIEKQKIELHILADSHSDKNSFDKLLFHDDCVPLFDSLVSNVETITRK